MKVRTLLIISFLWQAFSYGQPKDVWLRFYDTTTELSGFKDLKGNIKIPAKFANFTSANTFHNIIAVNEQIGNTYKSYYLLKTGKKVGQDSVYMFDFTYDCESEGKIIFTDGKKDRVGFLDKHGKVTIPAIYNFVSPFRNNIAIALRNAKRKCWDEKGDTTNCEHLGWDGGEVVLINEQNEVLVDSFNQYARNINWYSKRINDPSLDTNLYISFKGRNGKVYSFISYEKEFKKWYSEKFLAASSSKSTINLKQVLFLEVTFWDKEEGWVSQKQDEYLKTFPTALSIERFKETTLKQVSISSDHLNELIFDKDLYKKYLTSCGQHNEEKYPLFNVMLTYYKKREEPLPPNLKAEWKLSEFHNDNEIDYQENFEFLRTEKGYKLLSASIKR